MKGKAIKLLENKKKNLHVFGVEKVTLNRVPKGLTIKEKDSINWTKLKLRSSVFQKTH